MAEKRVELISEERRRQMTVVTLGAGLFLTTLAVNNERALFSPLGDIPVLGSLSPTAYAMTVGGMPDGRRPSGPSGRHGGGGPRPGAFLARVPPTAGPVGPGPSGPTGGTVGDVFPFTDIPGTPGGTLPGGGGSGGTGGGGDGTGGGGGGGGTGGGGGGTGGGGGGGGSIPSPTGAVPEPATWLTMILGFAVIGSALRRAKRRAGSLDHCRAVASGG